MRKVQILLIAALLVMNLVCFAWADATITLTGTLQPLNISIVVDPATLDFSMASGQTNAVQTITIQNQTEAPIKVTVSSLTLDANSWKPETVGMDPENFPVLSVADAQRKAAFGIVGHSGDGWRDYFPGTIARYILKGSEGTTTYQLANWQALDASGNDRMFDEIKLGTLQAWGGGAANYPTGSLTLKMVTDKKRISAKDFQGTLNLKLELTT